jgi:hypothetical protein
MPVVPLTKAANSKATPTITVVASRSMSYDNYALAFDIANDGGSAGGNARSSPGAIRAEIQVATRGKRALVSGHPRLLDSRVRQDTKIKAP